jgi:hypothetical protein
MFEQPLVERDRYGAINNKMQLEFAACSFTLIGLKMSLDQTQNPTRLIGDVSKFGNQEPVGSTSHHHGV